MNSVDINILRTLHEPIQTGDGGEVVVRSGSEAGRVFFVKGRIAWAAESAKKQNFMVHLMDRTEISKEDLRHVYEECKRTGLNFAETVAEWGLLDQQTLRRLLLEHIANCLVEMLSWPQSEALFVPEQREFKGSMSFDLAEVIEVARELDRERRLPFSKMPIEKLLEEIEQPPSRPEDEETDLIDLPPEKRKKQRWIYLTGGLGALLLVAGGLLYWKYSHPPQKRQKQHLQLPKKTPQKHLAHQKQSSPTPLKKGVVKIWSVPSGARVYLDDFLQRGKTPTVINKVTVGQRYILRIEHPQCRPWRRPLKLSDASRPVIIKAMLRRLKQLSAVIEKRQPSPEHKPKRPAIIAGAKSKKNGTLYVLSRPKGAKIFLDGVYTGRRTPAYIGSISAETEHVVMVRRKGYKPSYKKTSVSLKQLRKVKFSLVRGQPPKKFVLVRVRSEPKGASVYINGKRVKGLTPLAIKLKIGKTWDIKVRRGGYQPWHKTVTPIPDVDLTLLANLKRR